MGNEGACEKDPTTTGDWQEKSFGEEEESEKAKGEDGVDSGGELKLAEWDDEDEVVAVEEWDGENEAEECSWHNREV